MTRLGKINLKERRDAAEHRQHILAAARQLFERQGPDATSMMEIAQVAGVGQGTLYRRFAHKGMLSVALMDENLQAFADEMEGSFAAQADRDPLDLLEQLFERLKDFNEQNSALLCAIADSSSGPRRSEFFYSPFYTWMHGTIEHLLHQAISQGTCVPLDVSVAADQLFFAIHIEVYMFQRHALGYSPEQILKTWRQLWMEGLRPRA